MPFAPVWFLVIRVVGLQSEVSEIFGKSLFRMDFPLEIWNKKCRATLGGLFVLDSGHTTKVGYMHQCQAAYET